MKSLVIVLLAALFSAEVCALNCYQCLSYLTNEESLNLPETEEGFVPCNGNEEIVDCSFSGSCSRTEYNFQYDVPGSGRLFTSVKVRTCGSVAIDTCLTDSDIQEGLDAQGDSFQALLPPDSTLVSSDGIVCTCSSSNLCNSSPVWKGSFVVLLLSPFFSYVATKW